MRADLAAQRQGIGHDLRHGPEHGRGLSHGREEQGQYGWQEREASRASIRERLDRLREQEVPHHAQDGPGLEQSRPTQGEERQEEKSLGTEAIRERLEALRDRARPGAERVAGREADSTDTIQERLRGVLARERTEKAYEVQERNLIRERLQAVLDRARLVTQEQEGPGHERGPEGQAHEDERDAVQRRQRDNGWGYGL